MSGKDFWLGAALATSFILFIIVATGKCHADTYVSIGIVESTNKHSLQGDPTLAKFRFGVEDEIAKNQYLQLEIEHQSSIRSGPPFNDRKDEFDQNTIGLHYKYIWK